jgi:hypothetical protein
LPAFHIDFTPVIFFQDRRRQDWRIVVFEKQVGANVTSANAALLACGTCNFSLQCSVAPQQKVT